MSNTQQPERAIASDGTMLAVNSIFYTIQGEGPFAGCPAVFVRLAGCNLQCPSCDTEYSDRSAMLVESVFARALLLWPHANPTQPLMVLTGGEPFRQNIGPLVRKFLECGWLVQIESNGTMPPQQGFPEPGEFADLSVVVSPKTHRVAPELHGHIRAYKYVGSEESLVNSADGLPLRALDLVLAKTLARPHEGFKGDIFLQPQDDYSYERNSANLRACVRSCQQHGFRLCLQMHKIAGVD